jgi:diguanylate cyclase (GGDEF)-like protein
MATSSRGYQYPRRLEPIWFLAAVSLALAVLAAIRLNAANRTDLVGVAAACVAAGVVIAQSSKSPRRAVSAGSIALSAAITLVPQSLDVDTDAVAVLTWLLAMGGIVCWTEQRSELARRILLPAAAIASVSPLLVEGLGAQHPAPVVAALAVTIACLAFGHALVGFFSSSAPTSPASIQTCHTARDWLPAIALWIVAGATAIAVSISIDPSWTALAFLTIAAAMLVESSLQRGDRQANTFRAPDIRSEVVCLAAVACAAALVVAAIAAGEPFGWPVSGAAGVALAGLITLTWDSVVGSTLLLERLSRVAQESRVDALTGLANRRGFDERLDEEIARAVRFGHPLSLLMIDIDDFKAINDRLGHAAGDHTLETLSGVIVRSIRTIDIAGRFGGEEFVVVLPETPLDGAVIVAERIREGIQESPTPVPTSVSSGVAELDLLVPSREMLLERADIALYRAKWSGKNRVELFR